MFGVSRWEEVKRLFQATLERAPGDRSAFLDGATDDVALRSEVRSLLASHGDASSFLESPAVGAGAPLAAPSLAPGTRVGPYEIGARIGSGGMGEVYRARDVRLGREVAVKVLHASGRGTLSGASVSRPRRAPRPR